MLRCEGELLRMQTLEVDNNLVLDVKPCDLQTIYVINIEEKKRTWRQSLKMPLVYHSTAVPLFCCRHHTTHMVR